MQETAYRSFKKISTLKSPEFFKTWITKITISCAFDLIRRRKKIIQIEQSDLERIPTRNEDVLLKITLNGLINVLNEKEKTCILLKYYCGYNFKEIAHQMDIPTGTAKSILYRGLRKLKKQVRKEDLYGQ